MARSGWVATLALLLTLLVAAVPRANAAGTAPGADKRPLYLTIVGTRASQALLPDDLVEAMVREVLTRRHQPAVTVDPKDVPNGVTVLRVMVLVSQEQDAAGVAFAAAATTSLRKRPAAGGPSLALYQGMQQEMVTGPRRDAAVKTLRQRFKKALQKRVADALKARSG